MLENIKSTYILKWILSLLNVKVKLKLISYNKLLQEKCGIDIIDFKINCSKYIIKDKNGNYKIKSSHNNFTYYDGGYLNKEKHGYGKEYKLIEIKLTDFIELNKKQNKKLDLNISEESIKSTYFRNLTFDEKSKRGIINKNGEEYIFDIILEYKGGFQNGVRNGIGMEYDDDENLIFEGEYKNGKRWNGKGKEFDENNKLIYEGNFQNGVRNGIGKEYDDENLVFEGEFKIGKRWNGKGKEYDLNKNIIFEGEYKNGEKWKGKSKEYDEEGNLILDGEYLFGKINGKAKEYKFGNLIFEGEYKNGGRWKGKSKEYDEEGNLIFEGEYINLNEEKINLKGKEYDKKGNLIYAGEYLYFGKRWNGIGKEYDVVGNIIFDGEYKKGKRWNGKGIEYDVVGNIIFEGEYKNGKRWNGKEKEYDVIGNLKYEREYKNGIKSKEKGNENKIKNLLSDNFTLSQNFRFGKKGPIPTYKIKNVNEFDDIKYLLSESQKGIKILNCDDYVDKFINMFLGIEEKKDNTIKKGNKSIDLEKKSNEKQPNFKDNLKDSDYFSKEKYNGKGKEYDKEGNLIFEGEFKNGKRWEGILRKSWEKNNHDKTEINDGNYTGKQYYKGQIIFEGEFFLGKKSKGKKIFYDVNNNFLFKIDSHKNSFITQKEILLEIYSTYEGKSREKI